MTTRSVKHNTLVLNEIRSTKPHSPPPHDECSLEISCEPPKWGHMQQKHSLKSTRVAGGRWYRGAGQLPMPSGSPHLPVVAAREEPKQTTGLRVSGWACPAILWLHHALLSDSLFHVGEGGCGFPFALERRF